MTINNISKNKAFQDIQYLLGSWPSRDKDYRVVVQIVILQLMCQAWQVFGENLRLQASRSLEDDRKQVTYASRVQGERLVSQYRRVEATSKSGESLPTSDVLKACAIAQQAC